MEETGMWLLAATRAESTAVALFFAVLSSCFLLLVYLPRATDLGGTPHRVPAIAFMVALGWLVLVAGPSFGAESSPEQTLSRLELWGACVLQLGIFTIVASAYVFSRRPETPPPTIDAGPDPESAERGSGDDAPVPSPPVKNRFLPVDWPHHLAVGLTVGLASLLPTSLLGLILAPDRKADDSHILLKTLEGKGWDYLVPIIIAAAVLAPLVEELLFRVILQGWLADRVGKIAIVLTALLFALVHRAGDAALLVPLALILGALFEYRRSYLEVVAAHAAFNGANLFAAVNAS